MRSRHVAITGTAVQIYCSDACLRARDAQPAAPPPMPIDKPRGRAAWWIAGGLAVGTAGVVLFHTAGRSEPHETAALAEEPTLFFIPRPEPPPPPVETKPAEVKPTAEQEEDAALLDELARDAWIHPLAGPVRRMPSNHDAAFGALRPGDRPPECVSGHCGVDIGNNWGEPVHSVHDGVVEWVNRGPNDEHGGIFVKIAHRGGALYSWYFHLAGVPRWVQPGVKVKRGQVIGALGDTGVGHSEPHLHFSLSVKTSKSHERYLDPEPLIAIWPMWIPSNDNANTGHIATVVEPGLPVREHDRFKPKPKAVEPDPGAAEASAPAVPPASSADSAAAPAP